MSSEPIHSDPTERLEVKSGDFLPPWEVGDLPEPPRPGWKVWVGLIGPGVVLAGTSIGSGEWLFGPAVTAQYGAALLWLALLSILLQAFCNLTMMRYTVYCGEPIIVGGLRLWPGPWFWMGTWGLLEVASVWPYNASNAAVPVAAIALGHLPQTDADQMVVKVLGLTIFLLSFVPLIFGGTIYRMMEKIMTAKLVLVLGYLSVVAIALVSWPVIRDVCTGFFRIGTVPLRAETIILERDFTLQESHGAVRYRLSGSWENGKPTAEFSVVSGSRSTVFDARKNKDLAPETLAIRDRMIERARALGAPHRFFIETETGREVLVAEGEIINHHVWKPERLSVRDASGTREYKSLADIPAPVAARFRNLLAHEGVEYVGVVGYVRETGRLPSLDWGMVVAFIGIAGAGGLSNTLFSNYTRDKGWGMGALVARSRVQSAAARSACRTPAAPSFRRARTSCAGTAGCGTSSATRESGSRPRSWGWLCLA